MFLYRKFGECIHDVFDDWKIYYNKYVTNCRQTVIHHNFHLLLHGVYIYYMIGRTP